MPETLEEARKAAAVCTRCDLCRYATQTVFGEGEIGADVMFVGEQPGDMEDLAGRPFVGPAGKLFDGVLKEAGLDRCHAYVTNAVKHFKFEPRGKRRLHKRPDAGDLIVTRMATLDEAAEALADWHARPGDFTKILVKF